MRQAGVARRGTGWGWGACSVLLKLALLALLAMVAFPAIPRATVRAATDIVTNCSGDPAVTGSLPNVLAAATANDTITFNQDCADANGNTIRLAATLVPAVNVTVDATTPLHIVTISGNYRTPLFVVYNGLTLGLRGLTLMNGADDESMNLGGALTVAPGGTVTASGCAFIANRVALNGGAILNSGTLTVVNSTFSQNLAFTNGGAIANTGTLTVLGSTFTGNEAYTRNDSNGGALFLATGSATLTLSVVAGNTAGSDGPDIAGVVVSGGGNVIGNTAGASGFVGSDTLNVSPLLGALASNGGPVQTYALQPGSPAIDIAACPTNPLTGMPLATDARGMTRPQPGSRSCDAGAFESRGFTVLVTAGDAQTAGPNRAFAPLRVSVTANDPGVTVNGGRLTFTITAGEGGASSVFAPLAGVLCAWATQWRPAR